MIFCWRNKLSNTLALALAFALALALEKYSTFTMNLCMKCRQKCQGDPLSPDESPAPTHPTKKNHGSQLNWRIWALGHISSERACKNMAKVEIESFWDPLGVELWPNYCFGTRDLDFGVGFCWRNKLSNTLALALAFALALALEK